MERKQATKTKTECKKEIRKTLLKNRNSLTTENVENYSKLIAERLFSLKQYIEADTILIYVNYKNEVSTHEIIECALKAGKKVFCPKVSGAGSMEFYEITSLKDIVIGYKNIPEPKQTDFPYQNPPNEAVLMLMPLVGFDTQKNRLGYGGGFYDRYLQKFPCLDKIALGYECQKNEHIFPVEETDIKPDYIITEKQIY